MNIFKRTIGAVALAAVAAVGYGDDIIVESDDEGTVEGTGAVVQCSLDLSEGWTVTGFDQIDVPYSAVGWGIEENGTIGWTVSLELTPITDGYPSILAHDLSGRGTNSWDTSSVRNGTYVLRHYVRKAGATEPIETLEAYLDFDRTAVVRPLETLAAVAEAAFPDAGRSCAVTAMGGENWTAVGFAGEGIVGPPTGTATLTFEVDGIGSFTLEYRRTADEMLTVVVDGGEPQTLAAVEDWTGAQYTFGDAYTHTVVISARGKGTAVRGIRCDTGASSVGAIAQCALDLSEVWDKRNVNDEPILWSSLGWEDVAEEDSGKTVTLRLIPLSDGTEQTLGSGLNGHRQVSNWIPGEVTKQIYNVRHVVIGGSPLDTDLNAYFSFANYDHAAPKEADVRTAIRFTDGTGWGFGIVNDAENWWYLAGGPGEGLAAPEGESILTFTVDGHGTLFFDYALEDGTWFVRVDGVERQTVAAAGDWTGTGIPIDESLVTHTIEFVTELPGDGLAKLKNVRWVDEDNSFGDGRVGGGAVDLREGVLVVRRANELMPFTWSSTNFTGNALVKGSGFVTIDSQSASSVRVVQVTGEGDDVSQWTTEVAGTAKTLVQEKQGEGSVTWRGAQRGVWKAELIFATGGDEHYRETRILDLRKYVGPGLVVFFM